MAKVIWSDVPSKEAISYFESKKLKPSFDYRDVWQEEHATAFTVAKAVKVDVLADIQKGLQEALAEGKTFAQFKKELTPLLQKKGWWGVREMIDPETGDLKEVQLGSPRRLKTIYDANMRSARAAGQWERAQRTKSALPYFVYELGPSRDHREEHESWAGTILPVDHEFWRTHFAPNGYGCKCRIRQITKREAARLLEQGGYTTKAPKLDYVEWENKRTGEVETIPKGIDPGWQTNPGYARSKSVDKALVTKASVLDGIDADDLLIDPVHIGEYKDWVKRNAAKPRITGDQIFRTVSVMKAAEIDYLARERKAPVDTLVLMPAAILPRKDPKLASDFTLDEFAGLPELMKQEAEVFVSVKPPREMLYIYKKPDEYSDGSEFVQVKVAVDLNLQGHVINRISEVKYKTLSYVKRLRENSDYDKVR